MDVAIEAVGIPATFDICQEIVGAGGRLANVGVHGKPVELHQTTSGVIFRYTKFPNAAKAYMQFMLDKPQMDAYVTRAIDCFGFDRVMFGSDWPVVNLAGSYKAWIDVLDRVTAGASSSELRKLYRDNAMAWYRI